MSNTVTIKHSIFIARSPEEVYDFTQDFDKRPLWDRLVKNATVLETEPTRLVKMTAKDGSEMTIRYKLERRPEKTSLAILETNSQMMDGGGGSWQYEAQDGGTLWTQVNTVILKDAIWAKLMQPVATKYFKDKTIQAMEKVKEMMEE
ncbi:MAG: SRPBCC family protein [Chitinophagales bacterium]|nr:SRPBCC family protein [Chitinophagaceae bacterium]MCB9063919.1 SRPBCC family protein [Chitinophagales bacterium]